MSNGSIFFIVYYIMALITVTIGSYRAYMGKTSIPPGALDSLGWFLLWWIFLPIFIVRYIKAKIKGESL